MKKFNNRGFVLVETVVVSAFVLMIFVLVFKNGLPMMEEYKKLENYDDIDSLYAVNLVKDVFKSNMTSSDESVKELYYNTLEKLIGSSNLDYIDMTECDSKDVDEDGDSKLWSDPNLCETIKLRTNITENDKIYLTHSDPSRIKGKVLTDDRRFNGYIDYLISTYNEDTVKGPYMFIITRTIDGNNPYLEEVLDEDGKKQEVEKFENIKTYKYGSIVFQ